MAPDLDTIPMTNLASQFRALEGEITAAIGRVLGSGWYILGPEVSAFEREFADFCGVAHCVGVASGTDAVALALKSCGVQPGDEVVTVSHTAVATVAAIEQIGAIPVFVDIDPVSRCMDPTAIAEVITDKTTALVPVHIYGQPAAMPEIMQVAQQYGLKVVEDCAQAHGAAIGDRRVGSFGDAAAFSFYPTKNLGALGDGGAVVSNSLEIAERCRWLRQYGWKERYISSLPGLNSRLDELQAAVLRVRLPRLERDNARRREIAGRYNQAITGGLLTAPAFVPGTLHAMHLYVLETERREELEQFLVARRVCTARHYPLPIHLQPAYQNRIRGGGNLSVTERLCGRILSLPMCPELEPYQIDCVCRALGEFCGHLVGSPV